jgi:cell division protein FtsI (penicillin-binding protein 3)
VATRGAPTRSRKGSNRRRSTPSSNRGASRTPRNRHLRAVPSRNAHVRPSRSPRRILILLAILTLAFVGMAARLVTLQVIDFPRYSKLAAAQRQREVVFPAPRGTVFDRNGESLAITVQLRTVWVDPTQVTDVEGTARKLSVYLGEPPRMIAGKLVGGTPGDEFEYVARQIDPKLASKIESLGLPGIHVTPEPKRIYPSDRLASHVLGFVNADGDALGGIEVEFDEILRGEAGRMELEQDPSGRPLPQAEFVYERAKPGRSLFLTIDGDLQRFTEFALAESVRKYGAIGGSAIIMRPRTGEILAMASVPDFNPNSFNQFSDEERRNRAIGFNHEPGSSFKLVTAAAVLEEKLVTPTTPFDVPDQLQIADRVIHDSHSHAAETMTVTEIIEQSSNVGTVKLGLKLGPDRLDKWIRRFGFGSKTGLDLPGEENGILLDRDQWYGSTIGNVPLGQGIAVTQLQMAAAYNVLANRGMWVEPKLVYSTMQPDGDVAPSSPPSRRRVLSRRTARQMLEILTGVVNEGTGILAQIPGYEVAGKTGTAQKPLPTGGYGNSHIASFAGIAPARRPAIVVLVTLDEPSPIWGGSTAAPTFKVIAEYALRYLGVPPTRNAAQAVEAIENEQAEEPLPHD